MRGLQIVLQSHGGSRGLGSEWCALDRTHVSVKHVGHKVTELNAQTHIKTESGPYYLPQHRETCQV